jgi:glycosyltransferase involved in cell wall biosynthesis
MIISIVVPVYNTEKYLSRCIDSCLNQRCADIELVLVDDGSTDESYEICKNYYNSDNRVRLISQQNGGASAARNVGIEVSHGDYLMFVDSDDWIEPDMIDRMIYVIRDNPKIQIVQTRVPADMKNQVGNQIFGGNEAVRCLLEGSWWGPICKLISKELIGDIRFPEKTISEDYLFNYRLFNKANYVQYLDICFYHRTDRPDSLSKIQLSKRKFDEFYNVKEVSDWVRVDYPQYKLLADSHLAGTCLKLLFLIYENNADSQYETEREMIMDCIRSNYHSFIRNDFINKNQRLLLATCFSKYSARISERLYHFFKQLN